MTYKIIYKKCFNQKLCKLLDYLKNDWSEGVAEKFIDELKERLKTVSEQPYIGPPSVVIKSVRSILITKHNRIFYRIKGHTITCMTQGVIQRSINTLKFNYNSPC